MGDAATAVARYQESLAGHRATGNSFGITSSLNELGLVMLAQGDIAEAAACLGEALLINEACQNALGVALSLMGLAALAARSGRPRTAARLFGSVDGLRIKGRLLLTKIDASVESLAAADAKRALGDAEFAAAHAEGQALRFEEGVAEATELANGLSSRRARVKHREPGATSKLTPREREVLREMATGRSNREISDELFIERRTVETHVQHILAKLDVDTRTAAVAFAIRTGLV